MRAWPSAHPDVKNLGRLSRKCQIISFKASKTCGLTSAPAVWLSTSRPTAKMRSSRKSFQSAARRSSALLLASLATAAVPALPPSLAGPADAAPSSARWGAAVAAPVAFAFEAGGAAAAAVASGAAADAVAGARGGGSGRSGRASEPVEDASAACRLVSSSDLPLAGSRTTARIKATATVNTTISTVAVVSVSRAMPLTARRGGGSLPDLAPRKPFFATNTSAW
mmetsp:Transcript_152687/g.266100  ORF Transcript_152687/g.266100 Transcript_152687/m.266100 type:complete len:224 (-) Transcript_152687:14-685(-)